MASEITGPDQRAVQPPPFEVLNPGGGAGFLLTCDHASNTLPADCGGLGLEPTALARHIAYDIGAADVTRRLASALDAPAVLSAVSRLFIDLNRHPGGQQSIVEESDHVVVPGNQGIDAAERARRERDWFVPYHDAVSGQLDAMRRRALPALFAIHSFTPILDGIERPWQVGLLYKDDDRLARPLMAAFEAFAGVQVGDNLPYSGFDPAGYGIHVHGAAERIPHVIVELRQDLIDTHHGAEAWAGRLAAAIRTTVRQSQPWETPGE
ncbi:MAG TPA: N-formylglutamate amidohydrolase [Alphaproteobacteria bacterium]|jgi:predicted N-formylglutamate amidohydrolase|nr:N-formylglutamate amidohydrolase [Alphaproteobacteria bacterium]MDP6269853.1 N-formylglutamate amidohydrolase [Alphaproteobacteria bacterium]MDP7164959.1 N-formylglutamate amidohydrolase [Alphaproteobacteria bacterium]MDP7429879.1 N-formylglutamate amidohydrolase [Alphaproteobacteria bacterium]HJM49654.1 N-formylglutamate amidohydrolase [Alphaproteobacteria bacterium]